MVLQCSVSYLTVCGNKCYFKDSINTSIVLSRSSGDANVARNKLTVAGDVVYKAEKQM